ncbi:hypothetical protein RKE29_01545 [Streptomyces sp. B1866]|uniref:hypothetical protein n=1 Tax=Streptomyces sp. B1866 TaxID=3075431 RepID=UPI0028908EAD|nr:hypothetical protein [Streptomyces sp. B1866]MDT3395344.1 hypothetical protein [Streptomyces sp. B1866]
MPRTSPSSSPASGGGAGLRGRVVAGVVVLAVLTAFAGLFAYLIRDHHDPAEPTSRPAPASLSASPPSSASPSPSASATADGRAVAGPPRTGDPLVFAKAAAEVLWSYDTRVRTQAQQLAGLRAWMTREGKYADVGSVEALVASPVLWERMADNGQYATAQAAEAHIPAAFTEALQADPGAITEAYIYAVTVSGHQSISWNGTRAGGTEARSVTLAVQCRPHRPCALAAVMPTVAS